MGFWKQPRKTFLRRALFQVHLWTGVAIGIYIVLISITGSAVVFRRDLLQGKLGNVPAKDAPASAVRLSDAQLREAVLRQYPGSTITKLTPSRRRLVPSEVTLSKDGEIRQERFNPYTGADMGDAHPRSVAIMEWFVDLHDNLLTGETGRQVNAIGGALLCLMCLTGVIIWWRASGAWYKGFFFNPTHGWKRINFDLHAALGFWSLVILFMWGLTGIYFAFPDPFIALVDYFEPPALYNTARKGDEFIAWLVRMHFGRYGGMGVRITYVIIGLLPAVMFVTGAIMWWNRVLRRWVEQTRPARSRATFPGHVAAEPVD
jgi:uncharacterized iron-regulated membrane protein